MADEQLMGASIQLMPTIQQSISTNQDARPGVFCKKKNTEGKNNGK